MCGRKFKYEKEDEIYIADVVDDKDILNFLKSTEIEKISIQNNIFAFEADALSQDSGDYGFCGFYYSLNSKSQIVFIIMRGYFVHEIHHEN